MEKGNPEFQHQVVNEVDILKVISDYIELTQSTEGYYEGICPFNEKCGKSFVVNPHKKSYYCFGCHLKGDVCTFIAKMGNIHRGAAASYLRALHKSPRWHLK